MASAQKTVSDAEVRKVHRSALLIDTHNDVTSRTVDGLDIGLRAKDTHTDLVRMKVGGQAAVIFAVYVSASYVEGNRSAHRTLQMIDTVRHDIITKHPALVAPALTAGDIVRAKKQGKIAALMGIEGGHAIEDDLRLLRQFYALGVRYMTLTHSNANNWADSSGAEPRHNGLTSFGKEVVAEMNRLGMIVDISHVSDKTFSDVLEVSRAPVFASHSSCRALSNIPRNMTDDMIRALARKGGVVHVNFGCEFLSQKSADTSTWSNPRLMEEAQKRLAGITDPAQRREAMRKLREELDIRQVRATLDDVVAHIDHIRQVAGIDHIGIGSDFDGVSCVPVGLEDVSQWPNLTRRLLEKGYSASDIRKIYGGNFLRLLRDVEKAAAR